MSDTAINTPPTGNVVPAVPVTAAAPDLAGLQAHTDKAVADAVAKAKADAYTSALAKLGTTDLDAAAKAVKAHNDKVEADKSELQKAHDARAAAEAAAEAATNQAKTVTDQRVIERALIAAGVSVVGAVKVIPLVTVEGDVTPETAKAAVEATRTEFPGLFTPTPQPDEGTPSWGTNAGQKPPSQATVTALEKGAERWKTLHPPKAS